jgi:hypothetical protein
VTEFGEQRRATAQAPRKPVQTMNDDLINLSPPHEGQKLMECGAIEDGAGVTLIVEVLWDQSPTVNALRLNVEPTSIVLNLARREIIV